MQELGSGHIPCANTQYLDAYLAKQDRADRAADHFDKWVAEKAAADLAALQPFDAGAIDEAIAEWQGPQVAKLTAAFADGDHTAIGTALHELVLAYWTEQTRAQAINDYPGFNPDCEHCLDDGCLRCDGDFLRDRALDD